MSQIDKTREEMGNENVDGSAWIGKTLPSTSHGNAYLKVTQECLLSQISQHEPIKHLHHATN